LHVPRAAGLAHQYYIGCIDARSAMKETATCSHMWSLRIMPFHPLTTIFTEIKYRKLQLL